MKKLMLLVIPVIVLLTLAACSSGTTTTQTATTTTTPAGTTAGQLSASGQAVFSGNCARCHGANGQGGSGPAIIGSSQALAKYNTAQGLLAYVSANMPASSPGSLSAQQYLEVTAYLLVQNNFVQSGQSLDVTGLVGISLK
jgi:mono/diheme cytochrome c family protein